MDNAALTRAIRARADNAADVLFDRFGSELYDYCLMWLSDPEPAADALCYTLLVAIGRADRLVDPTRLEVWLFALARNECLRILQRGGAAARAAGGLDRSGTGLPDPRGDAGRRRHRPDAARETYELIHRHGLSEAAVASVLGVSLRKARALAAQGVITSPRASRAQDGWRTAVLPAGLRARVLAEAANPGRIVSRSEVAGPSRRSGFPVPLDQPDPGRRRLLIGAAVVAILAAGTALTISITSGPGVELSVGEPIASGYVPDETPTPEVPTAPASPSRSIAPSATRPTATPPASKRPAPRPASPAPPSHPPAPRPAPPQPQPPTGAIVGIFSDCLEVVSGTGIELLNCDGSAAQRWTVPGDGTVRALGGCMNVQNGGTENATRVVLAGCNGTGAQQWRAGADGSLINPQSGKCLDGPNNSSNPKHVEIWGCNGDSYQRWALPR